MVACLGHSRSLVSAVPYKLMSHPGAHFFSIGLKYKLPILLHQVVVLQLRIYLFKEKTLFALANAFHVHKQHGRKLASD